jgi:hypothetical protein
MKIQNFNYSVNLLQAIIWQYDEATNLLSLLNQKQTWYNTNQTQFWTDWYNNVFNLQTANNFGLSVWSYILNIPLFFLEEMESSSKPIWGFNAYTSPPTLENSYLNFGRSNFSIRGSVLSLTTEQQRFLLRLKYFQLSNRVDVTDVNKFLNYLTTTSNIGWAGNIYMLDNLNMTVTYQFSISGFPSSLLSIIQQFDVLPRPTGVGIIYSL